MPDMMNVSTRDTDVPLTPEELESLLWIERLGRRQCVPHAHFETLFQVGYITRSYINPITPSGRRRLAKGRFGPAMTAAAAAVGGRRKPRPLFWIATVLASVTGALCAMTAIWPAWLETMFGWDPDRRNASMEWTFLAGFLAITVALFSIAVIEWRRTPFPELSAADHD
jgi:hypothetical protein